jgi:aminopeptidase N
VFRPGAVLVGAICAGAARLVAQVTTHPATDTALITWGPPPPGTAHAERVRTFAITHQVVHVRFDWRRHAVVGTTTLGVTALDNVPTTRVVALDAVGMTIGAVTGATGRPLPFSYDGHTLTVRLPTALRAAPTTITIAYETVRPPKGAYFIDRRHVMWTQGATEETRYWLPTYDYPNGKETWEIYVRTARGEQALSNGRLVGSHDVGGETEWHWSEDLPASTYLMTVVTGPYTVLEDHWRGVPVDYWVYPDSSAAGWRGFGHTPSAIDLFSRLTGVDFPWAKYDQIVAPDFIFGGMENVTATTQSDDGILHPAWAEPERNADGLVSHELAHEWYGDDLTTRSWAHIWLNEGFATFMEQIHREVTRGVDAGALDRADAERQVVEGDRKERRPLVYDRWVDDPIELFGGGHIYPKGAIVLQMLRHALGDSTFWAAMHRYTVDHAFGSVESADLERAFEQTTGRDLTTFFRQWVYGAGLPAFRVAYAIDSTTSVTTSGTPSLTPSVTITARQVQPRDSLTGFFDANVDVVVLTDKGPVRGVMAVRGESSAVTLPLPAPPRAIRWDSGRWLLQVYDFPRPTAMLAYQLAHDPDVLGRLEAIALLERTETDDIAAGPAIVETAMSAIIAAVRDSSWAVRAATVEGLPPLAEATSPHGAQALAALLAATHDVDSRVRTAAASHLLGDFPGATPRLRELATTDSSAYVRGAALSALAAADSAVALPLIREALARDSWTDIDRRLALAALFRTHDTSVVTVAERYFGPATPRGTRRQALTVAVGAARSGAGSGPGGRVAEVAERIEPLLADEDSFVREYAATALGALGDAAAIPWLEHRRAVEPSARVLQAVDGALAALRR